MAAGPGLNLSGGDPPEQLKGIHVSREFFRLFGATTILGRTFTEEEDRPRGGRVVVLSGGLWQRRFGSDRGIAGRTISLGGEPHTILESSIPRSLSILRRSLPAVPSRSQQHQSRLLLHVGRAAKPGVTLSAAKAALTLAADEFRRTYPRAMNAQSSFTVEPMRDIQVRDARPALYVLLGAVGCVLLIACANVANLLLARATSRSREMAIRCAIGAGRGRIVRQLLTESLVLALAGGVLGFALGAIGVKALLAVNPGNIPRIGKDGAAVSLDAAVLGFTLALSVLTGVLFGLFPALRTSRADLNSTLKESTARSGTGLRQNKARGLLVVMEMALAIVLLVGAGLLIRSFAALSGVAPGFNAHNVLTMETSLTGTRYDRTAAITEMTRQVLDRIHATAGVESAAASSYLPLDSGLGLGFIIEGRALPPNSQGHGGAAWTTSRGGFSTYSRFPSCAGAASPSAIRSGLRP